MRPILYPATETAFADNGLGVLFDATSCTVKEERNGSFELEMKYPVAGLHYGEIAYRTLIMAKPSPGRAAQPFRVYRVSSPMNGMVTVYARHISYDLSGVALSPFSAQGLAQCLEKIAANAVPSDHGFTLSTDKTSVAALQVAKPCSIRALLGGSTGSMLDVYGGEYEFDRFAVKLWAARGEDRGVTIRYGKNLTSLTQEANCAEVYTAVYPFWANGEATVELPEKTVAVAGTYDYVKVLPLDLSSAFDAQPSADALRTSAQYYITDNKVGVPKVSLTLSFAQLEGETVELCDTVAVSFERLGISARAKIVATTYNVLLDRYDSVEVGDARASIADTIAGQAADIRSIPVSLDLQAAIVNATGWITGAKGGYVIFKRNDEGQPTEILIMDSPDMETARNVWRWNMGGLGFSRTGVNGPYETAITQDGSIVGKFVTADGLFVNAANINGKLTAGQIDATNLEVDAANVKGQLTADQIDATNLEVDAANVKGQLTANQIDATNLHVNGANIENLTVTNAMIDTLYASKIVGGGGTSGGYLPQAAISDTGRRLDYFYSKDGSFSGTLGTNDVTVGGGVRLYSGEAIGAELTYSGVSAGGTSKTWAQILSGSGSAAVFG